MEQKYIDELAKLGFSSNLETVQTVLAARAYHNTYTSITDCSYAVLNMPTCFDAALEEKIKALVFKALTVCYKNSVDITHLSYLSNEPRVGKNRIQFVFSDALTEEQIIEKVLALLQFTLNTIKEIYDKTSANASDPESYKKRLNSMSARVKAMQIFIEAGSTSYEYHTESYDPLD